MSVYIITKTFPRDEMFGLTSQIRRAIVSAASNIVEGSARQSHAEYLHFLNMAYASLREAEYQMSIAHRLTYLPEVDYCRFAGAREEASKALNGLICALRKPEKPETQLVGAR